MEKERINQETASRIIQQKQNHGTNSIVDKRPCSSLSFLSNPTAQRISEEDEEIMQGKFDSSVQRMEDEETLQGKFEYPVQRVSEEDEDTLQGKFDKPIQKKNETGMPDNLKAGIESLSGFSMDNVRVHYNSSKPATVQALAYTQGTDIHVAPGQEKHLPHEAWHVVQQMSGRVYPTTSINGMPINDNAVLEHEADVMGEQAMHQRIVITPHHYKMPLNSSIQCISEEEKMESAYITYVRYCSINNQQPIPDEEFYAEFSKSGPIKSKLSKWDDIFGKKRSKSDQNSGISWSEIDGEVRNWKRVISGTWVRALSINHFSYPEFYKKHILSSEGYNDMPNWTMGDNIPTRWLPGALGTKMLSVCFSGVNYEGYSQWKNEVDTQPNQIVGIGVIKELSKDFIGCYINTGDPLSELCVKGPLTEDQIDGMYLVYNDKDPEYIGKNWNQLPEPI